MQTATTKPSALYLLATAPSRQAFRAALMAMNVLPLEARPDANSLRQLHDALDLNADWMAVIDLQALIAPVHHPLALAGLLERPSVRSRVVLARGNRGAAWASDRDWVRSLGFCDLVSHLDCTSLQHECNVVLEHAARCTGAGLPMERKLQQYFSAMQVQPDAATPRGMVRRLTGVSAEQACAALAQGADTADRKHNTTHYPSCFVAAQGVDWLCTHYQLQRPDAVLLGSALQELRLVHHVVHEQPFADAHLFFRAAWTPHTDQLLPGAMLRHLRGPKGVSVRDRRYRTRNYPSCFVGSEAVDRLQEWTGSPRHACETALNRLQAYGLIEHVANAHPVRDGHYFYRFTAGAQAGDSGADHAAIRLADDHRR